MAWLAVNEYGSERIFADKPYRNTDPRFGLNWNCGWLSLYIELPKGSIKKLIGRELKWEDEPVELKDE